MSKNDIVIIGSGLSGLFAACVAAEQGKKVKVLSYGKGSLTIGCGYIDVLGYDDDGEIIRNPLEGIQAVDAVHPYAKIEASMAREGLEKFLEMTKKNGLPYMGNLEKNAWIPTAIGSFKPTCLVPKTTNPEAVFKADHLLVVGVELLKDFYSNIVYKNLKERLGDKKTLATKDVRFEELHVDNALRDVTAMDIARLLQTEAGYRQFVDAVRPEIKENTALIIPPILGVEPNYELFDRLEQELGCSIVEVSAIPPAVNGLRLLKMLTAYAKDLGVQFVDKVKVVGSEVENGKCTAVITEHGDRKRKFTGESFIVATGGVYGGGLEAGIGSLVEPIFDIAIYVPEKQTEWSHKELFADKKQIFAMFGVPVTDALQPVTKDGAIENVKIVGRTLAGYDESFEKSGNGVALLTAYKAAIELCREV